MPDYLHDIAEFYDKFALPSPSSPVVPPDDQVSMRLNFLLEELKELAEACDYKLHDGKFHRKCTLERPTGCADCDMHCHQWVVKDAALDALVDLLYVLMGTVKQFGLANVFDEAWRRIHQANMRKIRVRRLEDSKRGSGWDVVKPSDWEHPELGDLLI